MNILIFLIVLLLLNNSNNNVSSNHSIKNKTSKINNQNRYNNMKPNNKSKYNNIKSNNKNNYNNLKSANKNKTNYTKPKESYKKENYKKDNNIKSTKTIHTSKKNNNEQTIKNKKDYLLFINKDSKKPLTYTVIESLQDASEKIISNLDSKSKSTTPRKVNALENNKIKVNDFAYLLNNKYRGVNVSVVIRDLGVITGEVIFNFDSVVVLKLKNNITVFINKNAISGFY